MKKTLIVVGVILGIWILGHAAGYKFDPEPTCHAYDVGGTAVVCQDQDGNYVNP